MNAQLAADVLRAAIAHGPGLVEAVYNVIAIFSRHRGQALEVQRARDLELTQTFDAIDAKLAAQRAPTDRPPPGDEPSLAELVTETEDGHG